MTNASYSTQLVQCFGCFSITDVVVAATVDGERVGMQMQQLTIV